MLAQRWFRSRVRHPDRVVENGKMPVARKAPGRNMSAMESAIGNTIRMIPSGKVATYGQVAEAAGYPNGHRQVAQVLRKFGDALPWHRVLGAGGEIKTRPESALEQRMRLKMEKVGFRGSRVDMSKHQNVFNGPTFAKIATPHESVGIVAQKHQPRCFATKNYLAKRL